MCVCMYVCMYVNVYIYIYIYIYIYVCVQSLKKQPTKQQLPGHLTPIPKIIIRQTRQTGNS